MLSHGLPDRQNPLAKNGHCETEFSLSPQSPPDNRRLKIPQISIPEVVSELTEEWRFQYFWVLPSRFWLSGWHCWSRKSYVNIKPDQVKHEILRYLIQKAGQPEGRLVAQRSKIEVLLRVALEVQVEPEPQSWKEFWTQKEDKNFLIALREGQANG